MTNLKSHPSWFMESPVHKFGLLWTTINNKRGETWYRTREDRDEAINRLFGQGCEDFVEIDK